MQFTGGSANGQSSSAGGASTATIDADGAGGQNALLSMAMQEASQLFNQSGGPSSGSKNDVVSSAATTMMKLMLCAVAT